MMLMFFGPAVWPLGLVGFLPSLQSLQQIVLVSLAAEALPYCGGVAWADPLSAGVPHWTRTDALLFAGLVLQLLPCMAPSLPLWSGLTRFGNVLRALAVLFMLEGTIIGRPPMLVPCPANLAQ